MGYGLQAHRKCSSLLRPAQPGPRGGFRARADHFPEGAGSDPGGCLHGFRVERSRQRTAEAARMKRRKGTALIEFAGSLVLISTAFTGVFQLGQSFYTYNRLVNAVRQGARFASLQPETTLQTAAVQKLIVYGQPDPAPDTPPLIPGLSERNVQVIVANHKATVIIRDFALSGLFYSTTLDGKPSVTFPITAGVK